MSRFYDDVLGALRNNKIGWSDGVLNNGVFAEELNGYLVLDASNVAGYFMLSEKQDWDITTDFPNIAPPWERYFIEWRQPKYVNIGGGVLKSTGPLGRGGVAIRAVPLDSSTAPSKAKQARWALSCVIFIETYNHITSPEVVTGIFVDQYGKPCGQGYDGGPYIPMIAGTNFLRAYGEEREALGRIVSLFYIPFLTTSFLHCKNVALEEHEPLYTKKRRKRNLPPRSKYYTLNIEPMKEVLRREGNAEKTGIKQALHICRGHFVHYSEDRPLFGKYSGTFWRPMHVRGSAEHGTVQKNYQIGGVPGDNS